MPIQPWPASPKQLRAFQAALSQLAELHPIPAGLTSQQRLPIYNVGLRDVIAAKDPSGIGTQVSWRYFATDDGQTNAVSGDVDLSEVPRVTSLSYGPEVLAALKASDSLDKIAALPADDFEPRLLRIPGLLLECFWLTPMLQPESVEPAWVVPYHTVLKTQTLDKTRAYESAEFLDIIRPLARRALADKKFDA
jgi:hypothetical protein